MKTQGTYTAYDASSGSHVIKLWDLPDDAPESLKKNSIWVKDPKKVFHLVGLKRQGDVVYLVRRFMNQMLYGCDNPLCRAPTCLSYKKRVARGPFRRITVTTARALAFSLASQDDPENALCQNKPLVPLDAMPEVDVRMHASNVANDGQTEAPSTERVPVVNGQGCKKCQCKNTNGHIPELHMVPAKAKDPKSFTQALFNTMAVRKLEVLRSTGLFQKPLHAVKRTNNRSNGTAFTNAAPQSHATAASVEPIDTIKSDNPNSPNAEEIKLSLHHVELGNSNSVKSVHRPDDAASTPCKNMNVENNESVQSCKEKKTESVSGGTDNPNSSPQVKVNHKKQNTGPKSPRVDEESNNVKHESYSMGHGPDKGYSCIMVRSLSHLSTKLAHDLNRLLGIYQGRSKGKKYMAPESKKFREIIKFMEQSIFYVLSTPQALVESFRVDESQPPSPNEEIRPEIYMNCIGIFTVFRQLALVNQSSNIGWISLWNALEALFVPPPELSFSKMQRSKAARLNRANMHHRTNVDVTHLGQAPYLPDEHAAHIIVVVLCALASAFPAQYPYGAQLRQARSAGTVLPVESLESADYFIKATDVLENELILRLVTRLVRAIVARIRFTELARNETLPLNRPVVVVDFFDKIMTYLRTDVVGLDAHVPKFTRGNGDVMSENLLKHISRSFLELVRTIMLKNWDGNAELNRMGPAVYAVEVLSHMFDHCGDLNLRVEFFRTPILYQRLDVIDTPVSWLAKHPDGRATHVLSYPFLFHPSALVNYFRAINYSVMLKTYESSYCVARFLSQINFSFRIRTSLWHEPQFLDRLSIAMNSYLVLRVRRSSVLPDALNQLWRRQRRELLHPLKVQMGMDEGEEGVDVGGVQQEFFRVALAAALSPDYGLFTTDNQTRMSWFRPCSLEPLYKFELLGLLFSLAVYNGLTLPVTFPIALYRKLLGQPVTSLAHITDGWPQLAKGLDTLLDWDDGDVGDVFVRTYEFTFDLPGTTMTVDMEKVRRNDQWPPREDTQEDTKGKSRVKTASFADFISKTTEDDPDMFTNHRSRSNSNDNLNASPISQSPAPEDLNDGSSSEQPHPRRSSLLSNGDVKDSTDESMLSSESLHEASLVTNQNREEYVKDYIFWLTDKSIRPQYEAFARGVYICLDRTALSIFNPEAFQNVVEGFQEVNIDELRRTVNYEDGYSANSRVIKEFWEVVEAFDNEQRKKLLEFVTSSDRVPVNGIKTIQFTIQRSGDNDERLPTSSTCFGRLLLPEYSTKEILKQKLLLAMENSKGFGVA